MLENIKEREMLIKSLLATRGVQVMPPVSYIPSIYIIEVKKKKKTNYRMVDRQSNVGPLHVQGEGSITYAPGCMSQSLDGQN